MKYIRYTLVDDLSGIAIAPDAFAPHGRRHPKVEGLNVLKECPLLGFTFIATCPDNFPTEGYGITVLSMEDAMQYIQDHVDIEDYNIANDIKW